MHVDLGAPGNIEPTLNKTGHNTTIFQKTMLYQSIILIQEGSEVYNLYFIQFILCFI